MTEEQDRTAQAQQREFPETMALLARVRTALADRVFTTKIADQAIREDLYTRVQAIDALRDEMTSILANNAGEEAIRAYVEELAQPAPK